MMEYQNTGKIKSIYLVAALVLSLMCAACAGNAAKEPAKKIVDSDQVMLLADETSYGEESYDEICTYSYMAFYNGTVRVAKTYEHSGIRQFAETEMSDEDYAALCESLEKLSKGGKENDVSAEDGTNWKMTYFTQQGETRWEFDGYVYGNSLLEDTLVPMLKGYRDILDEKDCQYGV